MYSKTRDRIIEKRAEGRQRMGGGRGKRWRESEGSKSDELSHVCIIIDVRRTYMYTVYCAERGERGCIN